MKCESCNGSGKAATGNRCFFCNGSGEMCDRCGEPMTPDECDMGMCQECFDEDQQEAADE